MRLRQSTDTCGVVLLKVCTRVLSLQTQGVTDVALCRQGPPNHYLKSRPMALYTIIPGSASLPDTDRIVLLPSALPRVHMMTIHVNVDSSLIRAISSGSVTNGTQYTIFSWCGLSWAIRTFTMCTLTSLLAPSSDLWDTKVIHAQCIV